MKTKLRNASRCFVRNFADVNRERKNLFYRSNMPTRRFNACSVAVRQRLFKNRCNDVQCESKNLPLRFSDIFFQTVGNF